MKFWILLTTAILITAFAGCGGGGGDGEDDDDDITVPPSDGGNSGNGGSTTEIVLKADSLVLVNPGTATNTGNFIVSSPGTIRTVVTWGGAPDVLVSYCKKSGQPANYAWATGTSGFQGTAHIAPGELGTYVFYIANSSGPAVFVSYVIYFTHD